MKLLIDIAYFRSLSHAVKIITKKKHFPEKERKIYMKISRLRDDM